MWLIEVFLISSGFLFYDLGKVLFSPLLKKMFWIGHVLYFLSIMPTTMTYQTCSMDWALGKTL